MQKKYNPNYIHLCYVNAHYYLPIVQYFIEKQNVDINIKGSNERAPLHCACEDGHLPIAEYLISKSPNIESKDTYWKMTPLHIAS